MEIKNPELYKVVMNLDKEIKGLNNSISSQYLELNNKLERARWVEAKNGSKRKMLVTNLVAENYDSIKQIKGDIQILRDFGRWHKINKKYHLYRILTPPGILAGIGALYLLFYKLFNLLF
jgi:hypothetical protein